MKADFASPSSISISSSSSLLSSASTLISPSVFPKADKHSAISLSSERPSGRGFLGSIRTTEESTLGGGLKLFLPTLSKWLTRANSCVFTERRQ
ncbi:hypothetical protein ACJIZ3_000936 [Penstemon smallii]|uniref:Uncharacterized protein n=1 Tax=Penstemon smallii TaxID=265156 RepID=A0ABD3U4L5_9LAMI